MQDQPSTEELLEAVAAYLFGDLRPQVPKEERFKVLVAANVCAVVAREIRAGDEPEAADLKLFSELLSGAPAPNREAVGSSAPPACISPDNPDPAGAREAASELSAAIRSGALDDRLDETLERLAEHVRRKLEIARPGYAGD